MSSDWGTSCDCGRGLRPAGASRCRVPTIAVNRRRERSQQRNSVRQYGTDDMVSSMKTTVDLPEALVREAQDVARAEGTTLRALVEDGLRVALERRRSPSGFRLSDASVGGNGLRPEFRDAGWDELRAAIYGGRA
jgi:hypothetical protein